MRTALCLLLAAPALAAPKKPAIKANTVAPMSPRKIDLLSLGTLRESEVKPEYQIAVVGDVASAAPDSEHGPAAAVQRDTPAQLSDGALAALAERQMRKNLDSIDGCIGEETKRNPQAAGTLTLQVTVVERKLGNLFIADDTIKSAALADCLHKASATWIFSLKAAEFAYPITLGKRR